MKKFIVLLVSSFLAFFAQGQNNTKVKIYSFEIFNPIDKASWRMAGKAIAEAELTKADYILLHLNTYGGDLQYADSIRTRLLNAKATTLVFIDNNAASAGALISIACDSIYMKSSGTIGAATVVDGSGTPAPEKYQAYMRGMMRATAEAKNRDPKIAEGMVGNGADTVMVITFTTKEAIENNYCQAEANSIEEVLNKAGIEQYQIVNQQLSFIDLIISFLLSPAVSSLLILLIFGGIYYELQTPGVGFPLAAALVGAVLYFAPLYLEGLAANWEILLFFAGLILLALEVLIIPGFGLAGILGILALVLSLVFSLLNNDFFDFSFTTSSSVIVAFAQVLVPLLVIIVSLVFYGDRIMNSKYFKRLTLQTKQPAKGGFERIKKDNNLVGKMATAVTVMRPAGKVEIEGKIHDATCNIGFAETGDLLVVLAQERFELVVKKRE